ncbi:unnamed protein product [Pedinophyceae sp. YPF-701]|nr:unnamed protein product [Pedinophyceae sp. YPF-701]
MASAAATAACAPLTSRHGPPCSRNTSGAHHAGFAPHRRAVRRGRCSWRSRDGAPAAPVHHVCRAGRRGTPAAVPAVHSELPDSDLPCLAWPPEDTITPGYRKTIHLYEKRFIDLLEQVLDSEHRFMGHIVVDGGVGPMSRSPGALVVRTPDEEMTMAWAGVCRVEGIQKLDVGALVTLQCEGRVALQQLTQGRPYLRARVALMRDEPVRGTAEERRAEEEAREVLELLRTARELAQKIYGEGEAVDLMATVEDWALTDRPLLETGPPGQQHLAWASRISYSALVEVPGMSSAEALQMHKLRQEAMSRTDLRERLGLAKAHLSTVCGSLGAKASLTNLGLAAEGGDNPPTSEK